MKNLFLIAVLLCQINCSNDTNYKTNQNSDEEELAKSEVQYFDEYSENIFGEVVFLNDSLMSVFKTYSDGICLTEKIIIKCNFVDSDSIDGLIECDHDYSYPVRYWQDYEITYPDKLLIKKYSEKVHDSLITQEGIIKEGYDFATVSTIIDTVTIEYVITNKGLIILKSKRNID